jgi:hypothetical protein
LTVGIGHRFYSHGLVRVSDVRVRIRT